MEQNLTNGNTTVYNISITKIVKNPLNEVYKVENIDELKKSIEQYGLKQPLVVIKVSEDKFMIIAGHRRFGAIQWIYSEGKTIEFAGKQLSNLVPCIFDDAEKFKDEDSAFFELTSSNNYRKLSAEEMKSLINKANDIYEKNKINGIIPSGAKRDWIAKKIGLSARTVDKYLKTDDETVEDIKDTKIKKATSINKKLESFYEYIEDIKVDEYGKTDRKSINNELKIIIDICKSKLK